MNSVVMQGLANVVAGEQVPESAGIEGWLDRTRASRFDTSMVDLAVLGYGDVTSARRAVAALDPVDYAVSVDPDRVDERTRFEIEWAPTTGIVDLMLDWDLPTLEITLAELAMWLGVEPDLARRALARLAALPGAKASVTGSSENVYVALDIEHCPLMIANPSAAAR